MLELALAIFGAWVLASMIAGGIFVTVRSRLERRRRRSRRYEEQVQVPRKPPAAKDRELKMVAGDKERPARR